MLTTLLPLQEEEVDVSVIVGHGCLLAVAEACRQRQNPDPDAPRRGEPEHDGQVDGDEPAVARGSIEDASQFRLLSGESSQLTVGTVVLIGPDQQEHAYHIEPQVVEIEHDTCCHAQEYRGDGDGIGRYTQLIEEQGPLVAQRAIENQINPFLCVGRLEGCLHIDVFLIHSAYFTFFNIISLMASAAASLQGAKLGQSLKSMIRRVPSGATMASPP